MMSKTIFSVLFFLLLQTCGIIFKNCNAGVSEQYQNCITQLQEELSNRIGEHGILSDAKTILNKIIKNRKVLKENAFSKNIIQYIKKHRTRLDALIKNHKIYLYTDDGIQSNSKITHQTIYYDLHPDQFWREFNKESWIIILDIRELKTRDLNPKSTSYSKHKYYYSTDATILLYALKSLQKGFFGVIPNKIEITEVQEASTVEFLYQDAKEKKAFFSETTFGKNIKRLEHEIGLKVVDEYQISYKDKTSHSVNPTLSFDVEDDLREIEDNKDSIFRRFLSYFWR